jgi:hypothetical protein
MRSTSVLRTSDDRGVRAGISSAATCSAEVIAASTASRSHRLGEYQTTTEPVWG